MDKQDIIAYAAIAILFCASIYIFLQSWLPGILLIGILLFLAYGLLKKNAPEPKPLKIIDIAHYWGITWLGKKEKYDFDDTSYNVYEKEEELIEKMPKEMHKPFSYYSVGKMVLVQLSNENEEEIRLIVQNKIIENKTNYQIYSCLWQTAPEQKKYLLMLAEIPNSITTLKRIEKQFNVFGQNPKYIHLSKIQNKLLGLLHTHLQTHIMTEQQIEKINLELTNSNRGERG